MTYYNKTECSCKSWWVCHYPQGDEVVSREKLYEIITPMKHARIPFSVGGSGLLYACGLVDIIHDWDVITDCTFSDIVCVMKGKDWSLKPQTQEFASDYVLQLHEYDVEIIGSFRINTRLGICKIPNHVFTWWDDMIPLASPEAWFVAYRLMGRDEKANLLRNYIIENRVDHKVLLALLAEPLSDELKRELTDMFT